MLLFTANLDFYLISDSGINIKFWVAIEFYCNLLQPSIATPKVLIVRECCNVAIENLKTKTL